jgi:hypothetical protein
MSQPIRSVTFDPIQSSGSKRSQEPKVVGEQRQADRQHPQSGDRQKPKNAAKYQQQSRRNPKPPGGRLPDEANSRADAFRQPINESVEAPVVGAHSRRGHLIGNALAGG